VLVATRARGVELIVQRFERREILPLRRSIRRDAGVQHQLRILHPALLIARAARHHQQVRRFSQRQRLALKLVPFRLVLGLPRGDVEDGIRCRIDDLHHEVAHRARDLIRRPRLRRR